MVELILTKGGVSTQLNPIISSLTYTTSENSMGTLEFTINATNEFSLELGDIITTQGDYVKFFGRIFKLEYTNTTTIKVTCYDILKYFKGTKYYVMPTLRCGDIIKIMCSDLNVQYGILENTPYVKAAVYTDKSFGDILKSCFQTILYTTGTQYVIRVEDNTICLRNLAKLDTNLLLHDLSLNSYTYTESAENIINYIEITQQNQDTKKYEIARAYDRSSMDRYGVLTKCETSGGTNLNSAQLQETANVKLGLNKRPSYTLSVKIPKIINLQLYDVLTTVLNKQSNYGYLSNISIDYIAGTMDLDLVVLGK